MNEKNGESQKKYEEYDYVADPPDGGYGWVIVGAALIQSCICMSCVSVFGVFAVEFIEYFGSSTSSVSWIGSILLFMVAPAGLIMPPLLERFGSRKVIIVSALTQTVGLMLTSIAPNVPFLFFSYGFLPGVAAPAIVLATQVSIQQYFEKKRARALSISIMGPALAIFIWPPMIRYFIDVYAWRGATLILAGIVLNGTACGCLLRPPPTKRCPKASLQELTDMKEQGSTRGDRWSILSEKYLTRVLMFIGWFGVNAGHMLVVVSTPIRANVIGLSKNEGALLLSFFGITATLFRIPAGFVGDLKCVKRNIVAGGFTVFCGLLSVVSLSFESFPLLLAHSILFGIGAGFYIGLQGACIYDVVGLKNIATGYSILCCAFGFSTFISVSAAGYLYDVTGSPLITVVSVGIVQALGGLSLFSIPFVQKYQRKSQEIRLNQIKEMENPMVSKLKDQCELPFTHSVEHIGQPV